MLDNRPPAALLSTGVMLPTAAGRETGGEVTEAGTATDPLRGPNAMVTGG